MTEKKIPTYPDTFASVHPKIEEITSGALSWMCDMGIFPDAETGEKWNGARIGAWPCHVYPYTSNEYGLLLGMWWSWWAHLDWLAPRIEYGTWIKFAMDMERIVWRRGHVDIPAEPEPVKSMLAGLSDLCRRTAELPVQIMSNLLPVSFGDAIHGANVEAANLHLNRVPTADLALSADSEYLQLHRKSIGMIFDTMTIEHAVEFMVPENLRCSGIWQKAIELGIDVMILQNDLNAVERDLLEGDANTAIYVLHKQHNLTIEEATVKVTEALTQRINEFLELECSLPRLIANYSLPKESLQRIQEIFEKLRIASAGCLEWYRETDRYDPKLAPGRRPEIVGALFISSTEEE